VWQDGKIDAGDEDEVDEQQGVVGGVFPFGTLWLMVRRLGCRTHSILWLGMTGILRLAVALGALLLLFDGHWERLVAAPLAFLAGRMR
jgi:F1F0 ATPase subunit 2